MQRNLSNETAFPFLNNTQFAKTPPGVRSVAGSNVSFAGSQDRFLARTIEAVLGQAAAASMSHWSAAYSAMVACLSWSADTQ